MRSRSSPGPAIRSRCLSRCCSACPLYSNAAGVLPLIEALHAKGVAMGTLLAFMMAVVALSLPEMILLRRVLKVRLIAIWAGTVACAITFTGLLFNLIL